MLRLREVLSKTIEENITTKNYVIPKLHIEKISKEIELKYNRIGSVPDADDLERIKDILTIAEKSNSWQMVNNRAWKKACWVLWSGNDPLISNKSFLNKYLEYCDVNLTSRLLKSIIHAYFRNFQYGLHGQRNIARFIREKLNTNRIKKILALWVERDARHRLFDDDKDFTSNAAEYISEECSATEYLSSLGLDAQLQLSNYSQELFEAIAFEIEMNISKSNEYLKLFEKIKSFSVSNNAQLRYPLKKNILIETLLCPWRSKTPPAELCRKILEFLIFHFHDPRTIEGRNNWYGVSEEALKVIRKWLASKTLEQFFEIIKRTAKDDHWKYRHKFWAAYYNDGYIDDAWAALGKDSHSEARFHASHGNDLMAATVKGRGVKADHSVLIFKISGLTIVEWSHDGMCRVWCESNRKSPKLYEDNYLAENLREDENFSISHHSSEKYNWQKKLSDYIERYAGVKMSSRKYEVKY